MAINADTIQEVLSNPMSAASKMINGNPAGIGFTDRQVLQQIANGEISALEGQGLLMNSNLTAGQEKWLDNMIASQNTKSAQENERYNAKNSTLWLAEQLNSLGLSPSGVTSMSSNNPNAIGAADNVKTNLANAKADRANALARSMISMASSMASAGIYGTAIKAVKGAASSISKQASSQSLQALKYELFRKEAERVFEESKRKSGLL